MAQRSVPVDGPVLLQCRIEKAWSQERLATQASVDPKTVIKAEAGRKVDLDVLRRLAEAESLRIVKEASDRIGRERLGRKLEEWRDLDGLFVGVKVAQGIRPRLSQPQYEELERRRRTGDYRGLNERKWQRRVSL